MQSDAVMIRELNPASESEIECVAQRMMRTLEEVEGSEAAPGIHSIDWLRERVRWHLRGENVLAQVYVAEHETHGILAHTIVRREFDGGTTPYGWFSTTYVVPSARRSGLAQRLLERGEQWMRDHALSRAVTVTSAGNFKLIDLYRKNGYSIFSRGAHEQTHTPMVALEKHL